MLYSEIISSPHVESVEVSGGRAKITCKDGWELTTFRATADSDVRLFGSSSVLYLQENQDTDFLFITTAEADFYRLKRDNLLKYDLEMREAEEAADIQ